MSSFEPESIARAATRLPSHLFTSLYQFYREHERAGHLRGHVCVCVFVHVCAYVCVCACVRVCVCALHTYVCVYSSIIIYISMHMHTVLVLGTLKLHVRRHTLYLYKTGGSNHDNLVH